MTETDTKVRGLSKRLKAAASLVREGSVTADVGCDHGKLGAALLLDGKSPKVYATDLRPGPLSSARELIRSLGLEDRCVLMLTDGLDGVPGDEVDDVVIAGIGADLTADILSRAEWLRDPAKRLILVPASKHEKLRRYLAAEGFGTLEERAVSDMGHLYTVILACWTGERRTLGTVESRLGKMDVSAGDGRKYLEWVRRRLRRLADSVPDETDPGRTEALEFLKETEELTSGT